MVTVINHADNRDVEISVKYVENDDYYIALDQATRGFNVDSVLESFEYYASLYGMSVDEYVQLTLEQYGVSTLEEAIEIERENIKASLGVYPYTPEEMVVSAVYSKKELMGQAGMNTLLGMGTVFVVLIFISFIISLFKYLPKLLGKKKDKKDIEADKEPANIPAPVPTFVPAGGENQASNDELVAVITAAIYAAEAASGNAYSKDTLVVRSIKRVNR
ncbi:MAG: OadG family protein [Lachnospiraceae bacterium]|nr:OadG family protein [Lachnospiraceae bacterium]